MDKLTDEEVKARDWSRKVNYLKRNLVTVARQIDYVFKQLWGKDILSGMHPIGQILNFDELRELQNRGAEHMHAPIHIVDAPKIDQNDNSELAEFIDKYSTCAVPDETEYLKLAI